MDIAGTNVMHFEVVFSVAPYIFAGDIDTQHRKDERHLKFTNTNTRKIKQ